MNAVGMARMQAVGGVLAKLSRHEHNALVAALSPRAAPVEKWGPVLAKYPDVVRARLAACQTGDLILTSTRVGSWVGNVVQVVTDSTWDHVAIVVRGHLTDEVEPDVHPEVELGKKGTVSAMVKPQYYERRPNHFRVDSNSPPALLECTYQGVHIYDDLYGRLLEDKHYDIYSTVAVRALQGVQNAPLPQEYSDKLEAWIAKSRGTIYEADAPLHQLFSEKAGGLDAMHCSELVTEALKQLSLVSPNLMGGKAPPCAFADGPFGSVKLKSGSYGPLEIVKADDESLEKIDVLREKAQLNQ